MVTCHPAGVHRSPSDGWSQNLAGRNGIVCLNRICLNRICRSRNPWRSRSRSSWWSRPQPHGCPNLHQAGACVQAAGQSIHRSAASASRRYHLGRPSRLFLVSSLTPLDGRHCPVRLFPVGFAIPRIHGRSPTRPFLVSHPTRPTRPGDRNVPIPLDPVRSPPQIAAGARNQRNRRLP
jgi:hypothetical protein